MKNHYRSKEPQGTLIALNNWSWEAAREVLVKFKSLFKKQSKDGKTEQLGGCANFLRQMKVQPSIYWNYFVVVVLLQTDIGLQITV